MKCYVTPIKDLSCMFSRGFVNQLIHYNCPRRINGDMVNKHVNEKLAATITCMDKMEWLLSEKQDIVLFFTRHNCIKVLKLVMLHMMSNIYYILGCLYSGLL